MTLLQNIFLIATIVNLILVAVNLYAIKGITINVNLPEKIIEVPAPVPGPSNTSGDLYDEKGNLKEKPEDFLREIAQNIQAIMLGTEVDDVRK
jgi:hypothetical protein